MNTDENNIIEQVEILSQNQQDPDRARHCIAKLRERILDLKTIDQNAGNELRKHYFFIPKAAAILILVILAGIFVFDPKTTNNVAWAEIVERFNSVKAFHATMYLIENNKVGNRLEIWQNSNQKTRLLIDNQVLFSSKGKVTAAFDISEYTIKKLEESEYNRIGISIAQLMGSTDQLSLDYIVRMFTGKTTALQNVTPQMNPDAMLAGDLLVYDLKSEESQEWMRIWALRESKLPTIIKTYNPQSGSNTEIMIDYSLEQKSDFYDADKYFKAVSESENKNITDSPNYFNRAYSQLKDPADKEIKPEDVYNNHGYHMPEIVEVGISPHGAVWVKADNAINTKANGQEFYGFAFLEDDLDRTYQNTSPAYAGLSGKSSYQIFIPDGYPFDIRTPKKLTFVCDEQISFNETGVHIGNVTIDKWKNQPWGLGYLSSETDILLRQANVYCQNKELDKCEKIISMVESGKNSQNYSNTIVKLKIDILIQKGEIQQAYELILPLYESSLAKYKNNPMEYPFSCTELIARIASIGHRQKARELVVELIQIKHDLSKLSKLDKENYNSEHRKNITRGEIARTMLDGNIGFSIEEASKMLGTDVTKINSSMPSGGAILKITPGIENWNMLLAELSLKYSQNPLLPGQFEIINSNCSHKGSLASLIPEVTPLHNANYYNNYNLHYLVQDYKKAGAKGRLVIPDELKQLKPEFTIISCSDNKLSESENNNRRIEFILNHFEYEIIETEAMCDIMVARHDGRKLEPYQKIDMGKINRSSGVVICTSDKFTLGDIFDILGNSLCKDIQNDTGINEITKLSVVAVYAADNNDANYVYEWYKTNFGITFEKTSKMMKVWKIQKKAR